MNGKVGIALKQRIREAAWKAFKEKERNPRLREDDSLVKKLQPFYKDVYVTSQPIGYHSYVFVRSKCVIEVQGNRQRDKIKDFMREQNLPGAQVTYKKGEDFTIDWLCE